MFICLCYLFFIWGKAKKIIGKSQTHANEDKKKYIETAKHKTICYVYQWKLDLLSTNAKKKWLAYQMHQTMK